MFGVERVAAGEDDSGGFEDGTVPGLRCSGGGGFGIDVKLASRGDGAADEGGDGVGLAGEGEGDVADDAGGGAEMAGRQDETVGGRGLEDKELFAGAGVKGEQSGDGSGVAVFDGDADGGGGGRVLRGGGGGEGVGARVFRGLGLGEGEEGGQEGGGQDKGDAHDPV